MIFNYTLKNAFTRTTFTDEDIESIRLQMAVSIGTKHKI